MKRLIKTKENFDIYFEMLPEFTPLNEYLPEYTKKEIKKLYSKIEAYDLFYFTAKVTAEIEGLKLGSDYLGCCLYENENDFIQDDYFADMVENSILDAKSKLILINKKQINNLP